MNRIIRLRCEALLRKVSHIEDIAVNKSMQGRKLGLRVIYITGTYGDQRGGGMLQDDLEL